MSPTQQEIALAAMHKALNAVFKVSERLRLAPYVLMREGYTVRVGFLPMGPKNLPAIRLCFDALPKNTDGNVIAVYKQIAEDLPLQVILDLEKKLSAALDELAIQEATDSGVIDKEVEG